MERADCRNPQLPILQAACDITARYSGYGISLAVRLRRRPQAYFIALIFRDRLTVRENSAAFLYTEILITAFCRYRYMLESFMTLIFRVELLACEGRRLFFYVRYRRCGRLVSARYVRTIISKVRTFAYG